MGYIFYAINSDVGYQLLRKLFYYSLFNYYEIKNNFNESN